MRPTTGSLGYHLENEALPLDSWDFRIFEGVWRRSDMTIYDHSGGST